MARSRARLTYGLGLDRETGIAVLDPATFEDLRNVEIQGGRLATRKGVETRTALSVGGLGVTPMTDVPFIGAVKSRGKCVFVGYENASRKLEVFTAASTGLNPVFAATWGVLGADAGRPLVFGVEAFGKFFLAHDHADVTKRLASTMLDAAAGTLTTLTADLDNTTAKNVLFRGVAAHLDYLFGWGFGTDTDRDRPEVLRASAPGVPTTFKPEHYFLAGRRGEPIIGGLTVGRHFLVGKETDLYVVTGHSRDTFGIFPADRFFGFAGSHLAVVVGGQCFFWSLEGPRVCGEGGFSEDLGFPLDLGGPTPEQLVADEAIPTGFACYRPDLRVVEFVFGDRSYCLHLRNRERPTWSYREYGVELRAAGFVYQGSGTAAPTAAPTVDALTATATSITVTFGSTGTVVGDEVLEVWLQVGAAGTWMKVRDLAVTGASQQEPLTQADGITPSTLCEVAARYRRGLSYTAGYTSTNPEDWPAPARGSITTGSTAVAPSSLVLSDKGREEVGGKVYNSFRFTIGRAEFALGSTSEIVESLTADPGAGAVIWSDASSITLTPFLGGYLTGPTPRFRYFFARHRLLDGTPSGATPLPGNPVNVAEDAPL